MKHHRTGPRALTLVIGLIGFGFARGGVACSRASDQELLEGKACLTNADCVQGYVCSPSQQLCVLAASLGASGGADASGGGTATGGSPTAATGGASVGGTSAMLTGGATSGGNLATGGATTGSGGGITAGGSGGVSATGGSASGGVSNTGGASTGGASTGGSGGAPNVCAPTCATGRACVAGKCASGWITMSAPPALFVARSKAAYATMGGKLFIWGGKDQAGTHLRSGAIYDPQTDEWTLTSVATNTPSARVLASAAWTGSRVIVWGGRLDSGADDYKNGASYDPVNDTWTTISEANDARAGAMVFASGNYVFFGGGWDKDGKELDKGERYQWVNNSWQSTSNDVLARREHAGWVADGASLYVVGGRLDSGNVQGDARVYSLTTNLWSSLQALPGARYGAFVTHQGSELWMWGGRDDSQAITSGYLLTGSTWSPKTTLGQPSERWAPQRRSGWAFVLADGRSAVIAGHSYAGVNRLDGGIYDPLNNAWSAVAAWPSTLAHDWGVGAWVNGQFVLWGGTSAGTATAVGERWAP